MFLVGDTVKSVVDTAGGVLAGILKLIAAYYIFDLDYPPKYLMVMEILQTFVVEEPYKKATSKKYKFFVNNLLDELHRLPQPVEDE